MIEAKTSTLTNAEINRNIAELKGYSIYHYDKDVLERCYFQLWDEDGDPVVWKIYEGQRKTEEEAWQDVPDWASDLNTAFELVAKGCIFTLGYSYANPEFKATIYGHVGYDVQPARAICLAWLEWQKPTPTMPG